MSRRWPDMRITRDRWTDGDAIAAGVFYIVAILTVLIGIAVFAPYAKAHDFLLNGTKNPAGEWCCGSYDCGVMISGRVKPVAGGYEVDAVFRITHEGKITDDHVREFWPLHEATPSPDGAYWRCKRPDGSPRCKFVPPPGS
jgi:hypothetical protein